MKRLKMKPLQRRIKGSPTLQTCSTLTYPPFSSNGRACREQYVDVECTLFRCVFSRKGEYDEAKLLLERALAIDEKVYGPDHPTVATTVNKFAALLERKV